MNITPVEQGFWSDIYRNIMWSISKEILWLLDGIFDIIDKIWRFRFFDNEYVNKIFEGAIIVACSWLILKVVLELIMNYIVKGEERSSPLSVYKGVIIAIVMMFLIPPLFQFGHNVSTALTDSVISVSGMHSEADNEGTISKAIIRAVMYEDRMEADKIDYFVDNWKYVDNINATTGGFVGIDDVYVYTPNFILLVVISTITVFLLVFVAIQLSKRVLEIALYKIIGPFCCTSLTSNKSKSFEIWIKSTMGVFLITVVQFVCIGLMLNVFGSAFDENGVMTGIFLIIGALLFVISTPTIISSLLNQQSGMMTAFGDMQSMMALGNGISSGLKIAGTGISGALSAGANIVKGGAKLTKGGISSISNMLNKGSKLTDVQKDVVKDTLDRHNPAKAYQQVNDFLNQNKGVDTKTSGMSKTNSNQLMLPHGMKYNPIRNQYINNNSQDLQNRKWY